MSSDQQFDEMERLVSKLPSREAPETLWPRIEGALRTEQQSAMDESPGIFARIAEMFRVPTATVALYAVVLVIGVGMSWYLLKDYSARQEQITVAQDSDAIMVDAQSDIDQAIFFYERAIGKLTVLAERNEGNLDPEFLKLQKEKIVLLQTSIAECKSAMRMNGSHPEVQHYLFAAYTDLQHTLQQMVSRAQ
jgi:hypothetical protein